VLGSWARVSLVLRTATSRSQTASFGIVERRNRFNVQIKRKLCFLGEIWAESTRGTRRDAVVDLSDKMLAHYNGIFRVAIVLLLTEAGTKRRGRVCDCASLALHPIRKSVTIKQ